MVDFPTPGPGLVVSYSYLWGSEAKRGQVEGRKDRPCAIIVALTDPVGDGRSPQVVAVPITHHGPRDPTVAVEIPARVKTHLGLDGERSWIIVNEFNVFVHYGWLPPRLFDRVITKFRELRAADKCPGTPRD